MLRAHPNEKFTLLQTDTAKSSIIAAKTFSTLCGRPTLFDGEIGSVRQWKVREGKLKMELPSGVFGYVKKFKEPGMNTVWFVIYGEGSTQPEIDFYDLYEKHKKQQ